MEDSLSFTQNLDEDYNQISKERLREEIRKIELEAVGDSGTIEEYQDSMSSLGLHESSTCTKGSVSADKIKRSISSLSMSDCRALKLPTKKYR